MSQTVNQLVAHLQGFIDQGYGDLPITFNHTVDLDEIGYCQMSPREFYYTNTSTITGTVNYDCAQLDLEIRD